MYVITTAYSKVKKMYVILCIHLQGIYTQNLYILYYNTHSDIL